jgi:hypothetical protein
MGIHHAIKEDHSKARIIKSIAAFLVYTLKKAVKMKKEEVCSGVSNLSYQIGILTTELRKRE